MKRQDMDFFDRLKKNTTQPVAFVKYWLQVFFFSIFLFPACTNHPFQDPGVPPFQKRFEIYFTEPGHNPNTMVDKGIDRKLVKLLDSAEDSIDAAFYEFNRKEVYEAMQRARDRGLQVRFAGDVDENESPGYRAMAAANIPMMTGNGSGIMHHKFVIIDQKILFNGTGNITDNGFLRNDNNFFIIESPELCQQYLFEFDQLFTGRFARQKEVNANASSAQVNGIIIESYFSPMQGNAAMSRIIKLISEAKHSILFYIYAFSHDELSASLIQAEKRGIQIQGIFDSSFVQSTGSQATRLYSAFSQASGSQIFQDGNENFEYTADFQSGGKLHAKTMLIDPGTENAKVITGSFNWSNNSVNNNDENVMIFHSRKVSEALLKQWQKILGWSNPLAQRGIVRQGDTIGVRIGFAEGQACSEHVLKEKDILINEIHWAGSMQNGKVASKDLMIELRNLTPCAINISHWILQWLDETGSTREWPIPDPWTAFNQDENYIIGAHGYLVIHTSDDGAFPVADIKIPLAQDFKFPDHSLQLILFDKRFNIMDIAGNGGFAFAGGQKAEDGAVKIQSMERRDPLAKSDVPEYDKNGKILDLFACTSWDGSLSENWCDSLGNGSSVSGGSLVAESYRGIVIASPGEANQCP